MRYKALCTIVFCTLFAAWQYVTVAIPSCPDCPQHMDAIVNGTADAPFVYRVLTPAIVVAMGNTFQAYTLYHLILFAIFFSLLWVLARRARIAPVGVLLLATVVLVVTMPTYYFSMWSIIEWNLLAVGLLLLQPFSRLPR